MNSWSRLVPVVIMVDLDGRTTPREPALTLHQRSAVSLGGTGKWTYLNFIRQYNKSLKNLYYYWTIKNYTNKKKYGDDNKSNWIRCSFKKYNRIVEEMDSLLIWLKFYFQNLSKASFQLPVCKSSFHPSMSASHGRGLGTDLSQFSRFSQKTKFSTGKIEAFFTSEVD